MDETIYKRSPEGREIAHGSNIKKFRLRFRGQMIDVTRTIRIGRGRNNDIVIPDDPLVSRQHAIIEIVGGKYHLRDRGSTNQTYLNKNPVPPDASVVIRNGDTITIGRTLLEVSQF